MKDREWCDRCGWIINCQHIKRLTEIWDEEAGDNAWCLPEDMGDQ